MLDLTFEQYVQQLLEQHRGERILPFTFNHERYWLKQPERLFGVWKILKPTPKQAFINEITRLQFLQQKQAPVPELVLFGEDFLVLKDAGMSVGGIVGNQDYSASRVQFILQHCVRALTDLHKQGLSHGRPALRDMLWQNGKVTFIDFEMRNPQVDSAAQKARDALIFIHSLCREENLTDAQIQNIIAIYRENCSEQEWQDSLELLSRFRCLYYALLPLKPVAKTDLIAIYRVFENIRAVQTA